MSEDGKYATQVAMVKEECKDAREEDIVKEFKRYEEEFLIPPEDALRSVMRKFQAEAGIEVTKSSSPSSAQQSPEKKANRFSDLGAEDRNVTIEVAIVSYTPRVQKMKSGEERQIAFGWIEDNPWEASDKRVRWDYKDWGDHSQNLAPGSIVRLEGVSVNEWNDKRSININRTSRVSILKEGGATVHQPSHEPLTIEKASASEGFVNLVARVVSTKPDVIVKKDGSGQLHVVRGRLADSTGSISMLSWADFEHEAGTLVRIEGATVRRFRDTPEVNISDTTRVEVYHDNSFASLDELSSSTKSSISELRNGMRDIEITLQVETWNQRSFTAKDGTERVVRSGDVMDPTGRCRLTAWCDFDPKPGDFIHLNEARVQSWQGSPDLVIDDISQATNLENPAWDQIDPNDHWVDVELTELVGGGTRRGIRTTGTIVFVTNDSGIIERCPVIMPDGNRKCRKRLRDGNCIDCGPQRGEEDLRVRLVMDDGVSNVSLLLSKEPAQDFLNMSQSEVADRISKDGQEAFLASIRDEYLGRRVSVNGLALIDDQGAMILADSASKGELSPSSAANQVMEKWGVTL